MVQKTKPKGHRKKKVALDGAALTALTIAVQQASAGDYYVAVGGLIVAGGLLFLKEWLNMKDIEVQAAYVRDASEAVGDAVEDLSDSANVDTSDTPFEAVDVARGGIDEDDE